MKERTIVTALLKYSLTVSSSFCNAVIVALSCELIQASSSFFNEWLCVIGLGTKPYYPSRRGFFVLLSIAANSLPLSCVGLYPIAR